MERVRGRQPAGLVSEVARLPSFRNPDKAAGPSDTGKPHASHLRRLATAPCEAGASCGAGASTAAVPTLAGSGAVGRSGPAAVAGEGRSSSLRMSSASSSTAVRATTSERFLEYVAFLCGLRVELNRRCGRRLDLLGCWRWKCLRRHPHVERNSGGRER